MDSALSSSGHTPCGVQGAQIVPITTTPNGFLSEDWTGLIGLLSVCEREVRKSLSNHTLAYGLSDIAFLILLACRQDELHGVPQLSLAEKVGASPSSTSGAIDQLRKRELVTVERPERDRRCQLVRLTTSGSRIVDEVLLDLTSWTVRMQERISREEIKRGNELLSRISKIARETPVLRCFDVTDRDSGAAQNCGVPS